jgi:LysM repeat protein
MTREEFISMMGYRDDSPLRNEKSLDIQTGPNGIIDMSNTGTPLMANGQYLAPYSGHHQFAPNSIVTEIPLAQTGWEVPKRKGVRKNKDGTHSTHLMRTETLDGINWFSFPSLFQNEDGTWVDMSTTLDEDWMPAYKEALKRGEIIDFGEDKEAAIKFGEGSWKKELRNGGSLPRAQEGVESGPKEIPEGYKWNGNSLVPKDWSEVHDEITVDFDDLEKGIRHVESLDGVLMKNPQSSASGFYGDLFDNFEKNGIEYDGDRDAFIADTTFQKNLFLKRYSGEIKDIPGLENNGIDLYKEYTEDESKITKPDGTPFVLELTPLEIAALSNILGREGTRKYIGYHLRDGQPLASIFPKLYGEDRQLGKDGKPLENKTPEEYIEGFNKALEKKALGGSVNSARERTKKLVRQYRDGGPLTNAGRKHLEDIGVIDIFQTGGEYTVKRGDTLSAIAANNNMTVDSLAGMNDITNVNRIFPGQKLQLSAPVVTGAANEEEEPVITGYDHHENFSAAFGAAREDLGVNHIFDYRGNSFVTNLEGEPVDIPDSVRNALGNQQDQVDSLYSNRSSINVTTAQDTWQNWDQRREDIADFNRMNNVDIITGYESGRLGGAATASPIHTTEAGDNLTKIAQKYGSTIEAIMEANPQISHPNDIGVGDDLSIPAILGDTYMILNKQTHQLQVYRQGSNEPLETYLVGTGTIEGDAQTVTVPKDINGDGVLDEADENARGKYDVDWRAGNSQTGAGIFTIDGIVENSRGYYDETGQGRSVPSFGLVNEAGIRISTGIHGVPWNLRNTSRLTNTVSDDITKKNMTHGCVNGRCSDLREMYSNPGITEGTKLYILPEEEGNEFVYQNGKLIFKSSAENQNRYNTSYIDEDGNEQTRTQGINRTINTLKYNPIKIEFDRTQMQKEKDDKGFDYNNDREYDEITTPFLQALIDNKQKIMKVAQVNGDTYNDIVKLTIGLFGQESGFGEINSTPVNAVKLTRKFVNSNIPDWLGGPRTSSSADPLFEQGAYDNVYSQEETNRKSIGWTQLRWDFVTDEEKSILAQLGITSGRDFTDPAKAAIGTAALLSTRSQTQTGYQDRLIADNDKFSHITNKQEALIAGWNPAGPAYTNNVLRFGNYATLYEIDAEGVAGELNTNYDRDAVGGPLDSAIRLYEEYVEGWFEKGGEVKALYNKLNRVYYNDAKAARTGVLDYMKSLVN